MKLWLLRPIENLPNDDNPWFPWYDKSFGFIIRAKTEKEARDLAFNYTEGDEPIESWQNPKYSNCIELKKQGDPEIIMVDFKKA